MLPTALVVQCFIKQDTLEGVCNSLLRCEGIERLHLIFWCDSPVGSKHQARYSCLNKNVLDYLSAFIKLNESKFASVVLNTNDQNLGTCKTCQVAMDYSFLNFPFAIFVEDDVVFSSDALVWFNAIHEQQLLNNERYWAITGESIFFNAGNRDLPESHRREMLELARRENLAEYYIVHNFLPSTCFATTAEKWQEFGATRGQPLGDVDICTRCAKEDRHAIFPVVPRVKDVGMLHENGYSVSIHTIAGVSEIKNTYVMAEDVIISGNPRIQEFTQLRNGAGELYDITSKSLCGQANRIKILR